MANWCYGELKISGSNKDIENFLLTGITPVDRVGSHLSKNLLLLTKDKLMWRLHINCDDDSYLYIDGTHRGFIDKSYISIQLTDNVDSIMLLQVRFANKIDEDALSAIAKKFNINIYVKATEETNEFERTILIDKSGKIIINETKEL